MEFKGTKGKWESSPQKGIPGHCYQAQVFVDGISMACIEPTEHEVEASANALLISKAPQMLDFLNRLSGEMLRNDFVLSEAWYDQAQQLIKSATQK